MDINKLYERLDKNKEKLEKTYKTLENHKKQLIKKGDVVRKLGVDPAKCTAHDFAGKGNNDVYWGMCEYEHKLEAIDNTKKKVKEIEIMITEIEGKIAFECNQNNIISDTVPQILKDFVESWKKLAYEWHVHNFRKLQEKKDEFSRLENNARLEFILANPDKYKYLNEKFIQGKLTNYDLSTAYPYTPIDNYLKALKLDSESKRKLKSSFGGVALTLDTMHSDEERDTYLNKMLEKEKRSLLLDLMARISKVVGVVTDASNLYISDSGQINGYVVGNKSKAIVETIGAGGYNIQCFHFRTLVKEIK